MRNRGMEPKPTTTISWNWISSGFTYFFPVEFSRDKSPLLEENSAETDTKEGSSRKDQTFLVQVYPVFFSSKVSLSFSFPFPFLSPTDGTFSWVSLCLSLLSSLLVNEETCSIVQFRVCALSPSFRSNYYQIWNSYLWVQKILSLQICLRASGLCGVLKTENFKIRKNI